MNSIYRIPDQTNKENQIPNQPRLVFAELSRWLYTRTQVGAIRSVFAEPSRLLIASLVGLIIHIKLIETNASFDLTKV